MLYNLHYVQTLIVLYFISWHQSSSLVLFKHHLTEVEINCISWTFAQFLAKIILCHQEKVIKSHQIKLNICKIPPLAS